MSKCTCNLIGETGTISGSLRLSQESIDSPTIIEGEIKGLAVGKHGISINVYGDMTGGATTCGPIFNPKGKNHGAPQDEERMAGDLGNVIVNTDESCTVHIEDSNGVKLIGPHSVIGRSVGKFKPFLFYSF